MRNSNTYLVPNRFDIEQYNFMRLSSTVDNEVVSVEPVEGHKDRFLIRGKRLWMAFLIGRYEFIW